MVFNRKGSFFLNLDEKAPATPAAVAPVAQPSQSAEKTKAAPVKAAVKAEAPVAEAAATAAPTSGPAAIACSCDCSRCRWAAFVAVVAPEVL